MLTTRDQLDDKLEGFQAGADDYLVKPFSVKELEVRLEALIKRGGLQKTQNLVVGDLHYDLGTRTCTVTDRPVALTSREDQLLRRLLLANGACVTRQELLDDVWGASTTSGIDGSNVDIYLRRLREKLAPVTIDNVRGLGYRITA